MSLTSQTGSLVIIDAHKPGQEKVLWKGQHLDKVVRVKVDNGKVCLHVKSCGCDSGVRRTHRSPDQNQTCLRAPWTNFC